MMSEDIRIDDDVLAWHDDVFEDVQSHLRDRGYLDNDEFIVGCRIDVVAEDGVYIREMNTVSGVKSYD